MKVFKKVKTLFFSLFGYEIEVEMKMEYSKPKFGLGERVTVKHIDELGEEGFVADCKSHSIDKYIYYVILDNKYGLKYRYYGEDELDYSKQKKRELKLKELGI